MQHPSDELAADVGSRCLYTFTAPLPFPLRTSDGLAYSLTHGDAFADLADQDVFGTYPAVDIRAFSSKVAGLPMWPAGMHEALKEFYDYDFEDDPEARYGEDEINVHHQWVTLETPSAPTQREIEEEDPAFAFHRCLSALNMFLRGVQAATAEITVRPVTSHDLRPLVVVGAVLPSGDWKFLTCTLVHPEARPDGLSLADQSITEKGINAGVAAVATQQPYLTAMLWRARAQRALWHKGDPTDAIISFQISAESLIFDTYRMLLIDEGMSSVEVLEELEREHPFKALVTRVMPSKLGGRWDIGAKGTPVDEYWTKLYRLRNSVIHRGVEPHGLEAEEAQEGYRRLRDHLEERLREKKASYPRTVYARLGVEGLKSGGRLSRRMRRFLEMIEKEPNPWYWPYDVAERLRREAD